MLRTIKSKKAPAAIGPYSQAVVYQNLIFCSGQIGLNPKTGNLVEGLKKQTEQVLENLQTILKEAGSSLHSVLKTTVYLKKIADFPKMNEIYARYFLDHKPARATVEVSNLPKGALVEIEVIAQVKTHVCCCKKQK